MEERLKRLNRAYKTYKVLKWVFLIVSIAVALCPAIVTAIRVAPYVPKPAPYVSIASFAAVIIAIGIGLVLGGLIRRYGHKLPWAIWGLCGSWIMYLVLYSLGKVIKQAEQVSLALAIGMSIAAVLAITSDLFAAFEKQCEEEFKKGA